MFIRRYKIYVRSSPNGGWEELKQHGKVVTTEKVSEALVYLSVQDGQVQEHPGTH